MEITEIKVYPVQEDKLKAFVSVVFDQCFMVNDIKIIQGRDGLFISMPSRRKKNGEFKDVAHPLNNEMRQYLEKRVLGEYTSVLTTRGLPLPEVGVRPIEGPEVEDALDPPVAAGSVRGEASPRDIAKGRGADNDVVNDDAADEQAVASPGAMRPGGQRQHAGRNGAADHRASSRDGHRAGSRRGLGPADSMAAGPAGESSPSPPSEPMEDAIPTGATFGSGLRNSSHPLRPAAAVESPVPLDADPKGCTLEEVEELHLRDSFWSVP